MNTGFGAKHLIETVDGNILFNNETFLDRLKQIFIKYFALLSKVYAVQHQ